MGINKVIANNNVLLDLTGSTLSEASQLASGITAHARNGDILTGTATAVQNHEIETFKPIELASSYSPYNVWGNMAGIDSNHTKSAGTDDVNAVTCSTNISACGNVFMFTFWNLTIRYGQTRLDSEGEGYYYYDNYQYKAGTAYLLFKIPTACAPITNIYYLPGTNTSVSYFLLTTAGEFKICFGSDFNSAAKNSSDTNASKATSAGYQTNLTGHDRSGGFIYWRNES